MSGLSREICLLNLKSIALTLLDLLAFKAEKFRGHVTLATYFFVMPGLSLETYTSNLKSVALIVFELLAFNAQKFRGSRDPGHAPFSINFKGSCPHCPWKHTRQIWSP